MSWAFEIGRTYNRRADIHARYGGQQQRIITPAQCPVVVIITGEEGLGHGYVDRYRADGVIEYFGQGQVGDMKLRAGNRAIAERSAQGKGLFSDGTGQAGGLTPDENVSNIYKLFRATRCGPGSEIDPSSLWRHR